MIGIYILMVLLVLGSAFFSGSEIAFATLNRLRMDKAAEEGDRRAKLVVAICEDFPRFLSTILVGNELVNSAFSACVTMTLIEFAVPHEDVWSPVVAAAVLLIFGETIPKIIGTDYADGLSRRAARPLRVCMWVFTPIVAVVSALVHKLEKLWTPAEQEPEVTDDELVTILETIEDEGVFTEREGELIRSAIEFSDVTALDIYTPRVDVYAVDLDDDIRDILKDEDLLSYSRLPAYRESIDNVVGILSTKKLIKAAITQPVESIRLEDMLTEAIFVHKTRNISSILMEFKKKQCQMAIVADEYGGTMGILTLEDILEEIVGEIFDETDEVELDVVPAGEDGYIVDGGMTIDDFFESVDYHPPEDFETEYDTMGGWAIERLDRFPVAGDHFVYDIFDVTVIEAEAMRVDKLRVRILPKEEEE
jgi:CBS domain containing-hemolysin-like protein